MQFIGRITADAKVITLEDGRKVVNFSVAENDSYKPKGATEYQQITTFYNASYWMNEKAAKRLTIGTLIEIEGRVSARTYTDKEGNQKTALSLHVNNFKVLARPGKSTEATPEAVTESVEATDDLPF
jgi:single-strand DNA-binding protein